MENKSRLDLKDYKILRELDSDFRISFSQIGKRVGLSKNSVALRFEKLNEFMLHNVAGINNEVLGYTLVKVFYNFDFLNDKIQNDIALELKKHPSILWAARFYGNYDLVICLLVNNLNDLIYHVSKFNEKFSSKINQKELQIITKQTFFRNNFIHTNPLLKKYEIKPCEKRVILDETDKRILTELRYSPRINITEISSKLKLSAKTITKRIRTMEKNQVIMGYFMTLDPTKFNFNSYKLLFQTQNLKDESEFENYLSEIKNIKYITKMLGQWDYEVDCVYSNISDLQNQIELIKERFPNILKKISILSFGKRIATNKEKFILP